MTFYKHNKQMLVETIEKMNPIDIVSILGLSPTNSTTRKKQVLKKAKLIQDLLTKQGFNIILTTKPVPVRSGYLVCCEDNLCEGKNFLGASLEKIVREKGYKLFPNRETAMLHIDASHTSTMAIYLEVYKDGSYKVAPVE